MLLRLLKLLDLKDVLINGSRYQLTSVGEGHAGGETKRPGYEE